jgi:outer membrane protein TolC
VRNDTHTPRVSTQLRVAGTFTALLLLAGLPVRGDEPTPPGADTSPGLALDVVVERTLAASPDVQLARQSARLSRGVQRAAGSAFDLLLNSSASYSREHGVDPLDGRAAVDKQVVQSVSAQRLFRNGTLLKSDVSLNRRSFSTRPGAATSNSASVDVTVTVPLWRDRGGVLSSAAERAAGDNYEAAELSLQHARARQVLIAALAYWDYVAAQRRLDVFVASEQRAQRILDETQVLVEAEERTQADLTQVSGNLASKRVTRISAEQVLIEAREDLGLAMGLGAGEIDQLPAPVTSFPGTSSLPIALAPPGDLLDASFARRADLRAAEASVRAARTLAGAAHSELRPRLDLVVGSGYGDTTRGLGFEPFFAPLYDRRPQLDASALLRFQFPPANSGARGRVAQNEAAHEQQRILEGDLRRRIASGVTVAWQALRRGQEGMQESEQAVQLQSSTVQAEQRKFSLGVSTVFDVIQAQDGLTNAYLGQIQSQRNYAAALATLRFQTGTLLTPDVEDGEVVAASLLSTP